MVMCCSNLIIGAICAMMCLHVEHLMYILECGTTKKEHDLIDYKTL